MNYARRLQYRRLWRAGRAAAGSLAAALLALVVGGAGPAPLAGLLFVTAVGLGLYARHWLALAGRSRVGLARRTTCSVRSRRWRRRAGGSGIRCRGRGRGDIDSVAISPTGIAVAIETKTRTYDGRQLARVREQAGWLSRRRRRWARKGALGVSVMCLVRARGIERVELDVLVVSIDRLTHAVRAAAGVRPESRSFD